MRIKLADDFKYFAVRTFPDSIDDLKIIKCGCFVLLFVHIDYILTKFLTNVLFLFLKYIKEFEYSHNVLSYE